MDDHKPPASDESEREPADDLWHLLHGTDQAEAVPAEQPETTEPAVESSATGRSPDDYIPQDTDEPVAAVSDDVSSLERILYDPTVTAEDVAPAVVEVEEAEDLDPAIRSYYRDTDVRPKCKNHPDREAVGQCPECEAYHCQECMVIRRGRMLCRDCAETLYVPSEEEVLRSQELGEDSPAGDVQPEAQPEFQVGTSSLGMEGSPAHPIKRLLALLIDLLLTRAMVFVVLLVAGGMLGSVVDSEVFHLLKSSPTENPVREVFNALILLQPIIPWLVVFAVVDYLYFFLTLAFANRTFGMSWLGCRVISEWGDFVPFGAVALRVAVFMICLGAPAVLIGWIFPGYRGPHDYAAGTLVINYSGVKRIDAYETVQIKL